ncbi:hypothetical protein PPACK8108_LOCUS19921 [Phakopsora pachyrhizi]|uniref:Uncharacterized protein n=1 Tax=Phakopsora pachyrhizi TaxID=170000 RepID=A0AAV0BEN5_PHAPC|nr:hypothetical protein PPACK8108_LOCUS19921 [Phakopsora pachyrhizi]
MYRFRSEPDLLRLLNNRRNNKDCDGLMDEINHQPSNKSQDSLIINIRLRQHQQLIKSHQLDRKQSQQKFLSDSKSEGMMINSPLLNQDENLNLLTCDNNSPDRPSDNQYNSTIKTKIRNSRLSISDLSLTWGTQPVVSSSSTNQQRLNNLRLTVDPKPLPNHNLPQRTLTVRSLPPSEHPESNRSNAPGQSQPEHLANHQSSSKLEIKCKDEESEGDEELYSAQTHLSPKDEILPIYSPSREVLHIIVQDLNGDDLVAEPVKLQSSQKNYHWLRAFTISVLKNERNLTINSSRSSSSSFSSSISEAFHQLLPRSSTPVSNMLTNRISLIKSCSLKPHSRPLKQSVKSPVFMSTKSFNNSLDPIQSSQSHSSDIIRPGTSHASERNPTRAETFLSGSNLVLSSENLHNQHLLVSSSTLFLFLPIIEIQGVFHKAVVKKLSTSWRTISANVGFPRENETANVLIKKKSTNILSAKSILTGEKTEAKAPKKKGKEVGLKLIERIKCKQTGKDEDKKVGDLTKERDKASAKGQKSGGSKNNEMEIQQQLTQKDERVKLLLPRLPQGIGL